MNEIIKINDQNLFWQNTKWLSLLAFILICLSVAIMGALLTATSVTSWYTTINKPTWTPPNWLFGPVWTTLYIMMATAGWLVWRQNSSERKAAITIFFVQLFLNLIWSALFFTLQNPLVALVDIAFLWLAIVSTIVLFWRVSAYAGLLLIPYLIWVSYAAALNFAIWKMNS